MQLTAPVTRVQSLDVLRGTVMVLMAIDHVRVYSGIAPGGPDPGIFFTRWVTHFCAPLFVFLAGAAAYLYGQNLKELKSLSSFLLTRGFLLILLEFSIIRFCWTFNFDYSTFCLAGVIWMLGCSMIFLALLASLGPIMVGIIGLFIVFFQKIFQYIPQLLPEQSRSGFGKFWEFIYPSGLDGIPGITILYVLIPWIGVMAAGYWFGTIFQLDQKIRKKICFGIGLGSILAFIGIGSYMILSKPIAEDAPPFVFQLLNQKKYPASPLFLLMTIGPAITLIPWIEHLRGRSTGIFISFGRVPLFYYLLHIPLIHGTALLVNLFLHGSTLQTYYDSAPFVQMPPEYRWDLWLLYVMFIINVVILYFACTWYGRKKAKDPWIWMKYI